MRAFRALRLASAACFAAGIAGAALLMLATPLYAQGNTPMIRPGASVHQIQDALRRSRAASGARTITPQELSPPSVIFLVPFEFDSARPTREGAALLAVTAEAVTSDPDLRHAHYLIDGHTDATGTAGYNHVLGERRAEAVAGTLEAAGLSRRQMSVRSFGEERLLPGIAPDDPRNRRVEITPYVPR